MKKIILFIGLILFALSINSFAMPKDGRSQKRVCDANLGLCENVANTDKRNCEKISPSSNCTRNYNEDLNQCKKDHANCVGNIRSEIPSNDIRVVTEPVKKD
ncbi:MAG: hypothetical protein WAU15_04035 [Nitrosomonas sp.]